MREVRIARVVGFQGISDRTPARNPLMQVALALEGVKFGGGTVRHRVHTVFRWSLVVRLHYDGQEGRRDVLGALGGLRGGRGGLPRA